MPNQYIIKTGSLPTPPALIINKYHKSTSILHQYFIFNRLMKKKKILNRSFRLTRPLSSTGNNSVSIVSTVSSEEQSVHQYGKTIDQLIICLIISITSDQAAGPSSHHHICHWGTGQHFNGFTGFLWFHSSTDMSPVMFTLLIDLDSLVHFHVMGQGLIMNS